MLTLTTTIILIVWLAVVVVAAYAMGNAAGYQHGVRSYTEYTRRSLSTHLEHLQDIALFGGKMRRKIEITIVANLSDEEYTVLKKALRRSVRTILATTAMIGTYPPTVEMLGSDFYTNRESVDYNETDEEVE